VTAQGRTLKIRADLLFVDQNLEVPSRLACVRIGSNVTRPSCPVKGQGGLRRWRDLLRDLLLGCGFDLRFVLALRIKEVVGEGRKDSANERRDEEDP
jgi:hypothetical protein